VKSPPELWAEISDVTALARHLGEFGEIRITQLEPETTVAWEGDRARGTVELTASGWGTKVTLTAQAVDVEVEVAEAGVEDAEVVQEATEVPILEEASVIGDAEIVQDTVVEDATAVVQDTVVEDATAVVEDTVVEEIADPAPEPVAIAISEAEPKRRFWSRLLGRPMRTDVVEPEPVAIAAEPVGVEPEPVAVEPVVVEPVAVEPEPEPVAVEPVSVEPEPTPLVTEPVIEGEITVAATAVQAMDPAQVEAVLVGVLDDLGSAHHRPFSRG
jgi:hypothetical protein